MSNTIHVTIGLGNIKSLPTMPQLDVQSDIAKLRSMLGETPYFAAFGAEIVPGRYRVAWQAGMSHMRTHGIDHECPISTSAAIAVQSSHVERLTRGVRAITPDRFVTVVKGHMGTMQVALLASHNVSGSKNPRIDHRLIRKALFALWKHKMSRKIKRLRKQGFTVIVGGDENSPQQVHFHPEQINAVNAGLMQLAIIPADDMSVNVGTVVKRNGHTDHPLVAADIALTHHAGAKVNLPGNLARQ